MADLLDDHCDLLLVGDSLGMVVHGLPNPVGVTLEMMILHGQAVMRGSRRAMVVVDMPFGSYEGSAEEAFANASRIMKETGCSAVKVEAGETIVANIDTRGNTGIPGRGAAGRGRRGAGTKGGSRAAGGAEAERGVTVERAAPPGGPGASAG